MENPMVRTDSGIVQRDIHFDIAQCDMRNWLANDVCRTHFFSAMSVLFPEGEKFFIESVRHFRDRITDPALQEEVRGFIGQEAMHGREHRAYNARLAELGYDIDRMEEEVLALLKLGNTTLPAEGRLGVTIALEHFTAIMADTLLKDNEILEGADPRMAALWRWHAIEETEHKAVAYDVYKIVAPGLLGYLGRCSIMFSVTLIFWAQSLRNYFRFVRHDGIGFWKAAWSFIRFGLISPGPLRKIFLPYLAYYLPGFHPWKHNNRDLVDRWKAAYAADGQPPAII